MNSLELLNAKHLRDVAVIGPLNVTDIVTSHVNGIQLPTLHLFASELHLQDWEPLQLKSERRIQTYCCSDSSVSSHRAKLNGLFLRELKPVFDLVVLTQPLSESIDVAFLLLLDQLLNPGGYLAFDFSNLNESATDSGISAALLPINLNYLEISAGSLYRKRIHSPSREAAKERLLISSPVPHEVELCPYRKPARILDHEERAVCARLTELSNVTDHSLAEVPRHLCDACCTHESNSVERNPIVASELYRLALQIQKSGGVQGCSIEEVDRLLQRAEAHLEWVPGGEDPLKTASFLRKPEECLHLVPNTTSMSNGHSCSSLQVLYDCKHPDHEKTTLSECRYCRDFENGQKKPQVRLSELIPVAERCSPKISSWGVGVTTAPRKQSTLEACVDSIIRAGWTEPSLFVDRGTSIAPRHAHLPVTYREQRVGAWPNYYLALAELFLRQPNADAYMIVQDDAVLYDYENLREWLETALWPSHNVAAVSLYCSSAYTQSEPGWHLHPTLWVWGAQAFIFPAQSARRFLIDATVMDHRRYGKRGTANIDGVIGRWAIHEEMGIYYPTPSLVQHIGETSTLWPKATAQGKRRADSFAGDVTSPVQHTPPSTKQMVQAVEPVETAPEIKLGLVTSFFNPARFRTLRNNYERFREALGKSASHLWTIELAFDSDPFMIEGERTIRVRGTRARHQMWQKERLLNLAAEQLPQEYDAIGYIDCDLLFENPDWYSDTCQLLEKFPAVQLFTEICMLSAAGEIVSRKKSCVANHLDQALHPGGAWAFRRELWPIPDSHILGGGDTLFLYSMHGRLDHGKLPMMTDAWAYDWAKESVDVYRKCRAKIASTRGVVRHLYHGSHKNRQYRSRWQRLLDGGFHPEVDIEIDPDAGIWRWTESAIRDKSTMVRKVAEYFTERSEDE